MRITAAGTVLAIAAVLLILFGGATLGLEEHLSRLDTPVPAWTRRVAMTVFTGVEFVFTVALLLSDTVPVIAAAASANAVMAMTWFAYRGTSTRRARASRPSRT